MPDVQMDAVMRRWRSDHHAWLDDLPEGNAPSMFGAGIRPQADRAWACLVNGTRMASGITIGDDVETRTDEHMIVGAYMTLVGLLDLFDVWGMSPSQVADGARAIVTAYAIETAGTVEPCPNCSGPIRETVGLVCQTCGTDYGSLIDGGSDE